MYASKVLAYSMTGRRGSQPALARSKVTLRAAELIRQREIIFRLHTKEKKVPEQSLASLSWIVPSWVQVGSGIDSSIIVYAA